MEFIIRVISYYDKDINIYVKGDFNGKLELVKKMKNGAYLYQLHVHCHNKGFYNIEVYKNEMVIQYNFSIKRTFYVGDKYTNKKEISLKLKRGYYCLRLSFLAFYLILFIILFTKEGFHIILLIIISIMS